MSDALDRWTRRIISGEASLTDVPERERLRVARQVKAYADRFPDVGVSPMVDRLIAELNGSEVHPDGE